MTNLFIKPEYFNMLINIFMQYCPKAEVWAYGSRIKGNAHDGSDLDLVVFDFGDEKCSLAELKDILNDSDIPFLIDINEYKDLTENFQKEIKKKYLKIFPNNES